MATTRRTEADEIVRQLRLEELRLRSAALAFSLGIGSTSELAEAAHYYGQAARTMRQFSLAGATLTAEQAEVLS